MPVFGCIADDFTGASDAASFLRKGGMRVRLFSEIPKEEPLEDREDAWVIALKTRTQEVEGAVRDTLRAVRFLKERGVEHFYLKYCSTFDSTPRGNIGPIADAVMEYLNQSFTLLCPAVPVNERTVKDGILYVKGIPLGESPMKDHPLTPMWDSRIAKLMEPQSKYPCFELSEKEMREGPKEKIKELIACNSRFYLIPDFLISKDAEIIAELFGDLKLLTGGSGIMEALAAHYTGRQNSLVETEDQTKGAALLLAGSCSEATRRQIAYYQAVGGESIKLDPMALYRGETSVEEIWKQMEDKGGRDVLIYSSDTPDAVKANQLLGKEKIASLLENTLSQLAKMALGKGYRRLIIAGGETSGAVTKGLGFGEYRIGGSIAPGVPIMTPEKNPALRLVLKSGNFGQEDFFCRALEQTGGDRSDSH